MAPKSAKRRRTPSPSSSPTAKRTKSDLDTTTTSPNPERQSPDHQHDDDEVDHLEKPAASLFLQDNTDPAVPQQAKTGPQRYNCVISNSSNKDMPTASSLPHRTGFMDLPGELRNRIYKFIIEEMATTPDTPINLSKYCVHPVNRNWQFVPCEEEQAVSFPIYERRQALAYRKVLKDPNSSRLNKHPYQQHQIRKARENLVACQLNRVSRAVRNEFVPLLWQRVHFRYCGCGLASTLYHPRGVRGAPITLLRRNVEHLTFDTHYAKRKWTCDILRLARVMIALEFKGSLRVIGVQCQIDAVYKGILRASTAYRDGYAARKAAHKAYNAQRGINSKTKNGRGPVVETTFFVDFRR